MANNGEQGWTILEQYNPDTGVPTGLEKPNTIGDPDYVPPITNLTACPLPTAWRVKSSSAYCVQV